MKWLAAAVAFLAPVAALACDEGASQAVIQTISVDQLAELTKAQKATVYDANSTETRQKSGVIPGAKLLTSSSKYDTAKELPTAKDAKLVFGCKSGGRSQRACELLENAGCSTLVNMYGGFHGASDMSGRVIEPGWSACGYETTQETPAGRSWNELSGAAGTSKKSR